MLFSLALLSFVFLGGDCANLDYVSEKCLLSFEDCLKATVVELKDEDDRHFMRGAFSPLDTFSLKRSSTAVILGLKQRQEHLHPGVGEFVTTFLSAPQGMLDRPSEVYKGKTWREVASDDEMTLFNLFQELLGEKDPVFDYVKTIIDPKDLHNGQPSDAKVGAPPANADLPPATPEPQETIEEMRARLAALKKQLSDSSHTSLSLEDAELSADDTDLDDLLAKFDPGYSGDESDLSFDDAVGSDPKSSVEPLSPVATATAVPIATYKTRKYVAEPIAQVLDAE